MMKKTKVHNLIIVDASGSMGSVYWVALEGMNQTLKTIMIEDVKNTQSVTLLTFSRGDKPLHYIYRSARCGKLRQLLPKDYVTGGCTALYDAVGESLTKLRGSVREGDKVLVTIITDGLENDSRKWSEEGVKALVDELGGEGWVFTYIGANQDVEREARRIGIRNYLHFLASLDGTREMFKHENRMRARWNERVSKGEMHIEFNYFIERESAGRVTPRMVTSLARNEVFVFGSNVHGRHLGGAARMAVEEFGACYGVAEGMQGQSYAIPTVGCDYGDMAEAVERFIEYARSHRDLCFLVTAVGCGIAGHPVQSMAVLFKDAVHEPNISLPEEFWQYLE